jgi:dihydrofolate reductase
MKISIVVAVSQNGIIGDKGKVPWHISEDLRRFREITSGHNVLMGRKTYEAIGKPLSDRTNIVLTRNKKLKIEGCVIFQDFGDALRFAQAKRESELMVIGGEKVYMFALPLTEKIYQTLILRDFEGDAKFPDIEWIKWRQTFIESHEENDPPYQFWNLERRS